MKKKYQQWIVSVTREDGQKPVFEKLEKNFTWKDHGKVKQALPPVMLTAKEASDFNKKAAQTGLLYELAEA